VRVGDGGGGYAGLGNGQGIAANLYGLRGVLEIYGIWSGNGHGGLKIYGLKKNMGYDRGDCNRKNPILFLCNT
jgi:hypothetical protein